MATEASKTKSIWTPDILALFKGDGIDIGCGNDPIFPSVERFDQEQGDANHVSRYVRKQYDFVFSSHCLEHMLDPHAAFKEWYSILKPGGHLIVIIPDEDLFEQGSFPSLFNSDHKFTFTISKESSWSPKSVNVLDLVKSVPCDVIRISLQDHGYDRGLAQPHPRRTSLRLGKIAQKLSKRFPRYEAMICKLFWHFGALIDQTQFEEPRLAQIQLIVRKPLIPH